MITDKNFRTILQVILFTTLILYVLIGELPNVILGLVKIDSAAWIFKMLGMLISCFFTLSNFKNKYILKLLLRESYIAGIYEGYSKKGSNNKYEKNHTEQVEIVQTLISTKIIGKSFDENKDFYSTWEGKLIDSHEKTYKFMVNVTTPSDEVISILTFNIDNFSMKGLGISLETGDSKKWLFDLTKVAEKVEK